MPDSKATKLKRKPSEKKSKIATQKPRVGGRFVVADPVEAEKRRKEKEELELLKQAIEASGVITDEDRAYIGTDSAKFFERAMERAPTFYEGAKYAKELKPIQHPALQSIQSKQEVEVTTRVLRWSWEDDPTLIRGAEAPLLESTDIETEISSPDSPPISDSTDS